MRATEYRQHALFLARVFEELGRDGASRYYESIGLSIEGDPPSNSPREAGGTIHDFSLRRAEGWAVELLCQSIVCDTRDLNGLHHRLAARRALLV